MKRFKKMMALVIAMVMVVAMNATALADATTPHTIKITSDATQKQDHSYEAYQVFVGTYDDTSKQLQNFAWGEGVDSAALLTELKTTDETSPYYGCDTAAKVAAVLNGKADDSEEAKAFAEAIAKHIVSAKAIPSSGNKTEGYEIAVTGDGYYFIKDTTTGLNSGDTLSSFMLQVVGDVNVKAKDSTTSSEKKVKDTDDSVGTITDWQDSADYDIGDKVPFQLKGTVAGDYDKYTKYVFTFHDKESEGLTFNDDAKVYIDGKEITTGYAVVTTGLTDDCTFEVRFADLKAIESVKAGSVITVEYTSTLNDNAVVGQKGNPNTSHIEFSNNPNGDQSGTGTTPDDTVIVFTYKSTVTKVDENNNALSGADFTLYKEVPSTYTEAKKGSELKEGFNDNVKSAAVALEDTKYYVEAGHKTISGDMENIFEFKGIDDGTYVLVESKVPTGYNAWAAVQFKVEATHATTADIDPETGKIAATGNYVLTQLTGENLFGDNGNGTIILEAEKADLNVTITNKSGSTLPETGGMGTTLFYIIGGALVAVAGALLVFKKRGEN